MNLKNISKKQLFALVLTCLVLLIVLNRVLASLNSNKVQVVNYKNDTGASLVKGASVEYDREVYYNVENFVKQYIDSFSDDSYKEYYKNSLTDEYKKSISKFKYEKKAKSFYQKIVDYNTIETTLGEQLKTEGSLYSSDMLEKIYSIEENYYLCVLNLKNDNKAYIGLYFDTKINKAYIFYIE